VSKLAFFDSVHPSPLMPRWVTALNFVIPTGADPDSYSAVPPKATYAAFRKESRTKFVNATKLDRKSGGA
jgi:hypothetical protein